MRGQLAFAFDTWPGTSLDQRRMHALADVEIERAIDDGEGLRIDVDLLAVGKPEGAEAAIGWRVARRIGGKGVAVGGRGEAIGGARMCRRELRRALHGGVLREIGDRVVTVDRDVALREVDRRRRRAVEGVGDRRDGHPKAGCEDGQREGARKLGRSWEAPVAGTDATDATPAVPHRSSQARRTCDHGAARSSASRTARNPSR